MADMAVSGAQFNVRVTPNARKNDIMLMGGAFKISTTTLPEDGRATAAAAAQLAQVLGVAKTRLSLLRGGISRDKVFKLD
jgi:uncharacterized protein YggU (UPF0235/DUF167 family)